jgi:hypothetical protein
MNSKLFRRYALASVLALSCMAPAFAADNNRHSGAPAQASRPQRFSAPAAQQSQPSRGNSNAGQRQNQNSRPPMNNARPNNARPNSGPPANNARPSNVRPNNARPPVVVSRPGYRPPPPRYVPSLPSGYVRHYWNGSPYYFASGYWYRPWGTSFQIVAAPFGLYVPLLPSYYTSFWFGGSRYFYADSTYYLYDNARRGYVVTRSPYGDADVAPAEAAAAEQLYVYPAQGQSEQQTADDRYECHRWAVGQSGYDPVESGYAAAQREDYQRALSACLKGRGYTVQ